MDTRIQSLIDIKAKHNYSQEALARKIGVSTQTVYRWLHNKSKPLCYLEPTLDRFIAKNS